MDVLIDLIVGTISQYICLLNHHVVHFTYKIIILFVKYVSINLGKKKEKHRLLGLKMEISLRIRKSTLMELIEGFLLNICLCTKITAVRGWHLDLLGKGKNHGSWMLSGEVRFDDTLRGHTRKPF